MAKRGETTLVSLVYAVKLCRQQQAVQNACRQSASHGLAKYPGKVIRFSEFYRVHWQIRRRYVAFKRDVPSIGVSKFLKLFTLYEYE